MEPRVTQAFDFRTFVHIFVVPPHGLLAVVMHFVQMVVTDPDKFDSSCDFS